MATAEAGCSRGGLFGEGFLHVSFVGGFTHHFLEQSVCPSMGVMFEEEKGRSPGLSTYRQAT